MVSESTSIHARTSPVGGQARPSQSFALVSLALIALIAICSVGCESSQETNPGYPQRPIKLIVPFGAGGGSDTFGRIIQNVIEENGLLSQPLVIVNVPGAGGTIGSRRVKNARPDGYTLLLLHEGILTAKHSGQAGYGPEAFTPIAGTADATQVIAVAADSPYRDLTGLVDAATETPDSLVFSANIGAPSHFAGLMLESQRDGAAFRYTQNGGGAKRFAALQGGHVDVSAFSIAEYVQFRESGLRALALLGGQRHPDLPDLPTGIEQGFDCISQNMQFWWAPLGTPPERVSVIADAIESAMQTDEVRARLGEMKMSAVTVRGEALRQEIEQRGARIASVATAAPIRLPDFPAMILVAVVLLAGLAGWRSWQRRRFSPAVSEDVLADQPPPTPGRVRIQVFTTMALTLLYVGSLQIGWPGFVMTTFLYSAGLGFLLVGETVASKRVTWARAGLTIVAVATVMSIGMHHLFTQVLVVDLP